MNRHAADQLHVEVHHIPSQLVLADQRRPTHEPARGVFYRGERLGENRLKGRVFIGGRGEAGTKFVGLGAQLIIGERLIGFLELVDACDDGTTLLDKFPIVTAGKTFEEKREHERAETVGAADALANGKWQMGGSAAGALSVSPALHSPTWVRPPPRINVR